ncbi:MAG: alternative ribosome rescue aminoacyl-tRNA hydrolase ArfB [Planctomycetia bacterium]|nr:alternative ribosome rescue aminoacyl-tRNA hydrolase ArfB [Planctomycetia bacterium]
MSETTLDVHFHGRTLRIPMSEFSFTFVRSGGPGGQNVNKVSSKAVMRWAFGRSSSIPDDVRNRLRILWPSQMTSKKDPEEDEIVLSSQLTRDAPKNRADCLEKLTRMLELAMRIPRPRHPTRPGRGAVLRRLEEKNRRSQRKQERRPPEV